MGLLLFQEYTIQTHLSEEEIWSRLIKTIGQSGVIKEYMFGTTPYYGLIQKPVFTASRINPLTLGRVKPLVIQGTVTKANNQCEIHFTISPNNIKRHTIIILAWITGSLLFLCFAGVIFSLFNSSGTETIWGFFGFLISFFYLIGWIRFKLESITDRNFFFDLFEVPIE